MIAWPLAATVACGTLAIVAGVLSFAIPARFLRHLLGFAVGVLAGAAFLHMLPEAVSTVPLRPLRELLAATLGAMFACYAFERWQAPHAEISASDSAAALVLVSGALHNLADGLLIGLAFRADAELGGIVTLAILAHEVPREMGNFAVFRETGWSRARAVAWSAACRVPGVVAAVLGYAVLASLPTFAPYVTAMAAGVLIYVAFADLIPALRVRTRGHGGVTDVMTALVGAILVGWLSRPWP